MYGGGHISRDILPSNPTMNQQEFRFYDLDVHIRSDDEAQLERFYG
jgi:hypothetical protein